MNLYEREGAVPEVRSYRVRIDPAYRSPVTLQETRIEQMMRNSSSGGVHQSSQTSLTMAFRHRS